jgi:hypothetical protein
MDNDVQNFNIRDAELQAVGRNVVNFQKLEHCLKALVRLDDLAGHWIARKRSS